MKNKILLVSTLLLTLSFLCAKTTAQNTTMNEVKVSVGCPDENGSGYVCGVTVHKDLSIHKKVRFVIEANTGCYFKPEPNATPIFINGGRDTVEYTFATGGEKLLYFSTPSGRDLSNAGGSFGAITIKYSEANYQSPDTIWTITTTEDYTPTCSEANFAPSVKGYASAYIRYGAGHDRKLVRPIIFVDGIDFNTQKFTDPALGNAIIRHGSTGWDVLTLGLEDSPLDPDLENGQPDYETFRAYPAAFQSLVSNSSANGGDSYDIIFLDFSNGTDYIQRNSLLVQELIRRVNQAKVANRQGQIYKNVVLGASMGGLVVRHALTSMEKKGENHCTHTYVSFDAPQKGANIPLSLQSLGWFLNEVRSDAQSKSFWASLSTPAARQLIINHFGQFARIGLLTIEKMAWSSNFNTSIPQDFGCLRNEFIADLAALGYPKDCRNIAISCGSTMGNALANQGFSAGSELFDMSYHGENFGQVTQFQLYAQGSTSLNFASSNTEYYVMSRCNPSSQVDPLPVTANPRNILFAGALPASFNKFFLVASTPCAYNGVVVRNNVPDMPNLDHVPGCKRRDFPALKKLFKEAAPDLGVIFNLELSSYKRSFCFMPTMSTLDLNWEMTQANLERSINLNFAIRQNQTPFATAYAPGPDYDGGQNLKHVEITASMVTWLQEQILIGEIEGGRLVALPNPTMEHMVYATSGLISRNHSINQNGAIVLSGAPFVTVGMVACTAPVQVTINDGGNFTIGSDTTVGRVLVQSNSTVRINSNGQLNMAAHSELVIESGCKLILERGANIVLNGKIHIKRGGELVLDGQFNHSGSGYFEFDEGHIFNQTAPIVLRGGGSTVKLIQLNQDSKLSFTNKVDLRDGLIEYGSNAGMVQNTGDLTLSNLTFRPVLRTFNQIAYEAQNIGYININDVVFENFYKGLIINGVESAVINKATFQYCKGDNLKLQNGNKVRLNQVNISNFGNTGNIPRGIILTDVKEADLDYVNVLPFLNATTTISAHTVYGIELKDVPVFRFRNSHVSYCTMGIKADEGKNNIDMKFNNTISNNSFGIVLNGNRLPSGVTNYGRLTMSCSNLLDNGWGVAGRNIELNIDASSNSGNRSNVFKAGLSTIGGQVRNTPILFALDYDYDLPFIKATNNHWPDGISSNNFHIQTPSGNRALTVNPIAQGAPLPCSSYSVATTDPNCPNPPCFTGGGSTTENTINIDGEIYNLEVQYKEAYLDFDNGATEEAYTKFEPLTEISEIDYTTASDLCKKYIDVSKTMVKSEGLRSSNSKWVKKAKVTKNTLETDKLILYPNPSNDYVQLNINEGNYEVTLIDVVGKHWQQFDSNGFNSINVTELPNGVYFVNVRNKDTQIIIKAKITVFH